MQLLTLWSETKKILNNVLVSLSRLCCMFAAAGSNYTRTMIFPSKLCSHGKEMLENLPQDMHNFRISYIQNKNYPSFFTMEFEYIIDLLKQKRRFYLSFFFKCCILTAAVFLLHYLQGLCFSPSSKVFTGHMYLFHNLYSQKENDANFLSHIAGVHHWPLKITSEKYISFLSFCRCHIVSATD